ncbi:MAG: NAD(P)-dependent glycerol-3-phosphate dehydrogenase [Planctomycetes bacterium]|nr:NAD(P)-dependent glycerol-3-phosphate dehydrogenase [Planctomycetota bacterium]
MDRALVIGGGGWGTALALVLNERGVHVRLAMHDEAYAKEVASTRRNPRYLPGVELPDRVVVTGAVGAEPGEGVVFSVVPSQYLRATLERWKPSLDTQRRVFVTATKGIEQESLERPTEIMRAVLGDVPVVVLSGPSHAEEVARRMPTTVVAASVDRGVGLRIQDLLNTERFRVYTNSDPLGVELGGALKNVISIAGGIVDGLGFGDNTKAALLTRGVVEMARLGVALGAQRETMFGLAGIGDLITSCISPHGRNRAVGIRVGRGERVADIVASMKQVAEGVRTAAAVHALAARGKVEMPICEQVYAVLHQDKDPSRAVRDLMSRQLKDEQEW